MFKKGRIALILAVLAMLSIIISACGSDTSSTSSPTPTPTSLTANYKFSCVSGSIQASGSTALKPLVTALSTKYQAKCAGATIQVNGGGSGTGLNNTQGGSSNIGDSDIYSVPSAQPDLVDHQVAVVVFVLAINSKVTGVTNLTTAQIKGIFTGQYDNWSQVGGNSLPIVVISRPASSGTRKTLKQFVLGGVNESPKQNQALTADTTSLVLQTVESTDGSIGYAALGDTLKEGSKINFISIDGHKATDAALVKDNTYKFWNIEHMYTKGNASGLSQAFIDYVAQSEDARQEATNEHFVHIVDMEKSALATHPAPQA